MRSLRLPVGIESTKPPVLFPVSAAKVGTLLLLWLAIVSVLPAVAIESTYYDRLKMTALEKYLENYEWATRQKELIIRRAEKWLKYDDDRLRTLVPPPQVARAIVAHETGAPVNGDALNRIGRYSWLVSFDKPWKVTSPVDSTVYPSNDFSAFMASGFKDRSLLTGPYPDDGWGCYVDGEERPYWFVGIYAHWSVERLLLPALDDLSKAYLLTDNPRYAHVASLLLWQMSEYYPKYFYEKQSRYGTEVQPSYLGRLLYHTWESNSTAQIVPLAYDAIKPAIESNTALQHLTGKSPAAIRASIEDRLLRTMATDIMDGSGRILGNYGMHQSALLKIAATLKGSRKNPTARQMVDWVLQNPAAKSYTQLGLEDALANLVHRDGYPFESPSYNIGWTQSLGQIVSLLGDQGDRILSMPRFKDIFLWPIRMTVAGEFVPSYGDSNHMFHGLIGWAPEILEAAYRYYRDPIFAKAIRQVRARPRRDLFEPGIDPEDLKNAAHQVRGPLGVTSQLLPGVGFASLQTGSSRNRTALAMYYGYYEGHSHFDRLQLDLYSWRHALTPDFGYPETADSYDPRRFGFFSHTVAHNTVMVDAKRQALARGRLHLYDPGSFAQLVEVSAKSCYPNVDLYRRTLWLVDVSPSEAYIVDIFRIRGGSQHDWIVHGTEAELQSTLPLSSPRTSGTLAGEDVPYGNFYDDSRYDNENDAHVPYHKYEGSGYQWLFNVQESQFSGVESATWHLNRPEDQFPKRNRKGVSLRSHLVGSDETVLVADGIPQRREGWPESVKFLFRRRVGKDLESVFVTVFEPYKEEPYIKSVEALPIEGRDDLPVALKIHLKDRTHTLFSRLDGPSEGRSSLHVSKGLILDARAALLEENDDQTEIRTFILDDSGTAIPRFEKPGLPAVTSKVKGVDYTRGIVTVTQPVLGGIKSAGGIAIVESGKHASALTVADLLSDKSFSVGAEDLAEATVHVTAARGNRFEFHPRFAHHALPGMSVVNEAGRVIGRLRSIQSGTAKITTHSLTLRDFPDLSQDGRRTCKIVVIGPGDTLTFHQSTRTGTAKIGR